MRILYVEDHIDTAEVVRMLLHRAGHQVTVAHTAKDAKALCIDHVFDLWILDVGLPDAHGGDLLRALRKMADTRAIALTGKDSEHDVADGKDDGFDEYLVKPVNIDRLLAAMRDTPAPRHAAPAIHPPNYHARA